MRKKERPMQEKRKKCRTQEGGNDESIERKKRGMKSEDDGEG